MIKLFNLSKEDISFFYAFNNYFVIIFLFYIEKYILSQKTIKNQINDNPNLDA
jgi:hypothetical protein